MLACFIFILLVKTNGFTATSFETVSDKFPQLKNK